MSRVTIIAVAIAVVLIAIVVALANRNTEVTPHRIETPVTLGNAAGDAAPAP